jgi:hypothetical protein
VSADTQKYKSRTYQLKNSRRSVDHVVARGHRIYQFENRLDVVEHGGTCRHNVIEWLIDGLDACIEGREEATSPVLYSPFRQLTGIDVLLVIPPFLLAPIV